VRRRSPRSPERSFESKRKLQPWTRKSYRAALDNALLPHFGSSKLAAITPERVASLIRELEAYSPILTIVLRLTRRSAKNGFF